MLAPAVAGSWVRCGCTEAEEGDEGGFLVFIVCFICSYRTHSNSPSPLGGCGTSGISSQPVHPPMVLCPHLCPCLALYDAV